MKLDNFHLTEKDPSRYESKIKQKKDLQYKKVRSIVYRAGLTLFSFNHKTNTLKKAEFKKENTIQFDNVLAGNIAQRKVIKEQHCIYFQALNMKNAIKKLKKCGVEINKTTIL